MRENNERDRERVRKGETEGGAGGRKTLFASSEKYICHSRLWVTLLSEPMRKEDIKSGREWTDFQKWALLDPGKLEKTFFFQFKH